MSDIQNIDAPIVPTVSKDDIAYDSYQKVLRALEHFTSFESSLKRYWESDFYSVSEQTDSKTGRPVIQVYVKDLGKEIPLIVGDMVHNLRSALDILWNTMMRRLKGRDYEFYFPICENRLALARALAGKYKLLVREIPGLDDFLLNKAHLYKSGSPPGTFVIYYLNRVDLIDKHRLLIAVANVTGFSHILVEQKNHNFNFFENVIVRGGITEIPMMFPIKFEKLSYGRPVATVHFDIPELLPIGQSPPANVWLVHMVGATIGLIYGISELWRKTGRK